jgi:hypothetical protein
VSRNLPQLSPKKEKIFGGPKYFYDLSDNLPGTLFAGELLKKDPKKGLNFIFKTNNDII